MKALIIDNQTSYIEALLTLLTDYEVSVKTFQEIDPTDKDNFDLIILSGGHDRTPVNIDPIENNSEIQLIQMSSVPVIGICYGCQLVAEAFGGKITEVEGKVNEIKEIEFIKDFLDYKIGDRIKTKESHRYAVTNPGEVLETFAKSSEGFEIIKHKNRPIYGLQFHPEVQQELTDGDELFRKLLKSL